MQPVQSNAGSNAGEQGEAMPCGESSAAQPIAQKLSLPRKVPVVTSATALIWLSSIVVALALIAKYSNAPGRSGAIPQHWPAQSLIVPDSKRPTLIMFAHPHCPCTRASLGELDALMARCRGQFSTHVVFVKPAGLTDDLSKTELWRL